MKIQYVTVMISIFGILVFLMNFSYATPAFAHAIPSQFTSGTDKTEYAIGETIKISGFVANEIMKPGQPVIIRIFNPDGQEYSNATVNLESQKPYSNGVYTYNYTYGYDLKISSDAVSGYYQIMVYYDNSLQNSYTVTYDKTHVNYGKYFVYYVLLNNETYPFLYNLNEGNEIHEIGVDAESKTIHIAGSTVSGKIGQLTMELPRAIIDSKYSNGTDKNYTVAMGSPGTAADYTNNFNEIQKNAKTRTLQFDIPSYEPNYMITVYGTQSVNQSMEVSHIFMSPLKQFQSGIVAHDVTCKNGLQLLLKAEDGSPVCVKPDTTQILLERGWAKSVQ